jgi:AbrB family looped-hinge helix DNA binding protein
MVEKDGAALGVGMEKGHTEGGKVFHAKIDGSGRIVIPAEAQLRKNAKEGETVVLVEDDSGQLHLRTLDDVVREVQSHYRRTIPAGVSLADELIAERREEAKRE